MNIKQYDARPTARNEREAEKAVNRAIDATQKCDYRCEEAEAAAMEAAAAWSDTDHAATIAAHEAAAAAHEAYAVA